MDTQYHLGVFDAEVLPVARRDCKLVFALVFERLNDLISSGREHTDATNVGVFNLLDSDLPHRLPGRHLPCPVWILFTEHRRVGPISEPDLYRSDPSLSVLETDTSDLHSEHSTSCLAASIDMLLSRPSEPDEASDALNQGVFDLPGYLRLRSNVSSDDVVCKVLSLCHTTDVQKINRSDGFVNRFLSRR